MSVCMHHMHIAVVCILLTIQEYIWIEQQFSACVACLMNKFKG